MGRETIGHQTIAGNEHSNTRPPRQQTAIPSTICDACSRLVAQGRLVLALRRPVSLAPALSGSPTFMDLFTVPLGQRVLIPLGPSLT